MTNPGTPPTSSDVHVVRASNAGSVLAIGSPRLQLVPSDFEDFVVRMGTRRAFAVDRNEIKVWELTHGTLIERIDLTGNEWDPHLSIALSADGAMFAGGRFSSMVVRYAPFTTTAFENRNAHPHRFSRDGKRLIASDPTTAIVIDLDKKSILATSPKAPTKGLGTLDVAESEDGTQVWWLREAGLMRWDRKADKVTIVTKAATKWTRARIALGADVAIVRDDSSLQRLDLATGQLTRIGPRATYFEVSPSGDRVLIAEKARARVIDGKTGAELATFAAPGGVDRIAYTDDENTIALIENGHIRIVGLATGQSATESTSRFAGWVDKGVAAIQRGTVVEELDVATRAQVARARRTISAPPPVLDLTLAPATITIHDAKTHQSLGVLDVGAPPRPGTDLAHEYWRAVASSNGTLIALWWRRADVQGPAAREDDRGPTECERDGDARCKMEYFAEVWSVGGSAPARIWQVRPDAKRQEPLRRWPLPKVGSGPIAFTHDGKRVLFGFDDGDVMIRSTDATAAQRVESVHRAAITRIEVSPGDRWVFTEDAEGEQRIWPLGP